MPRNTDERHFTVQTVARIRHSFFEDTVADYIDFDRFGRDLIESDDAKETEYGYIYSESGFELDETPTMSM